MTDKEIIIDGRNLKHIKEDLFNGRRDAISTKTFEAIIDAFEEKEQECEKFKEENKLAKEIIKKAVVDFSIEYGTKQYIRLLNGAKLLGIEVLDEH